MGLKATSDLWWKNAVIYCLDIETFQDGDGDGCGDLKGLTESIDYLAGLGVTCVWLLPFYLSPGRDDGYDVSDFYGIDPAYGSMGDFVEFVRTAEDRGIRVIADLVVNHTSTAHPWFVDARSSRDSRYRDFYIWVDEPPSGEQDVLFPDAEGSTWAYDERTGQHYLHRFYREQADLNFANPEVRDEIHKLIGFWLRMGLSGFRVDAVPYLISQEKIGSLNRNPHALLRDLRGFTSRREGNAILLGEVNLHPQEQVEYFGGKHGDELHGVFHFTLNQAMFLAMAREDAAPLRQVLEATPEVPVTNQWATFVRNHDELTLDRLTAEERQDVFDAFGTPDSIIFGRGIRRRLPPMVGGDRRRIELAYSLMLSLPGTPVLLYGEEIGMGDNLDIPGRRSVRTPMQWTAEPEGGFGPEATWPTRPFAGGGFGPEQVNVADQRGDPESLLNWMERLIRRRKECPEIGWGEVGVVASSQPSVLLHRCDWEGKVFLAAHNLAGRPCRVEVDLQRDDVVGTFDLLGSDGAGYRELDGSALELDLDAYGYRWLRLHRRGHRLRI